MDKLGKWLGIAALAVAAVFLAGPLFGSMRSGDLSVAPAAWALLAVPLAVFVAGVAAGIVYRRRQPPALPPEQGTPA